MRRPIPINIPNTLTLLRILLTPLFAIFLIKHLFDFALLVFAIAALSDGVDGFIARVFRQKTTLGAFLDPAADKLLLVTAFVTLAIQEQIPSWLSVLVITRDVIILSGVALFTITGRTFVPKPSILSKITTVAQLACVLFVLMRHHAPEIAHLHFQSPLFWFAASVTMVSGFQYIYRGLNILQEEP
ncbi:MAG: CDP-diacylglycerol--glycerol-3-phosphate 3-phosphatidyltransferase [Deltaproteobacteria bacterium]|nr:CDP-diacylglycerol--glycerol-3-phosphate 3-phosphatidyltransferase [Deltaproteobacteria bacterium]MBW2566441.1 CDP-diacylglycerol--glycerol-3-phosphate 3-phosphatidyltransferase [Deltaproteobacteria bacterium]